MRKNASRIIVCVERVPKSIQKDNDVGKFFVMWENDYVYADTAKEISKFIAKKLKHKNFKIKLVRWEQ